MIIYQLTTCCGKGWSEITSTLNILKNNKIDVELHVLSNRSKKDIELIHKILVDNGLSKEYTDPYTFIPKLNYINKSNNIVEIIKYIKENKGDLK